MPKKKQLNGDDEIGESRIGSADDARKEIDAFLKGKSKAQLIGLILEIAEQYPEIAQDLADRRQIVSGETEKMVKRLGAEIRDLAAKPGWQNYWHGEGYTPDYSLIRNKFDVLLKEGHADEVLMLGRETPDRRRPTGGGEQRRGRDCPGDCRLRAGDRCGSRSVVT